MDGSLAERKTPAFRDLLRPCGALLASVLLLSFKMGFFGETAYRWNYAILVAIDEVFVGQGNGYGINGTKGTVLVPKILV